MKPYTPVPEVAQTPVTPAPELLKPSTPTPEPFAALEMPLSVLEPLLTANMEKPVPLVEPFRPVPPPGLLFVLDPPIWRASPSAAPAVTAVAPAGSAPNAEPATANPAPAAAAPPRRPKSRRRDVDHRRLARLTGSHFGVDRAAASRTGHAAPSWASGSGLLSAP